MKNDLHDSAIEKMATLVAQILYYDKDRHSAKELRKYILEQNKEMTYIETEIVIARIFHIVRTARYLKQSLTDGVISDSLLKKIAQNSRHDYKTLQTAANIIADGNKKIAAFPK